MRVGEPTRLTMGSTQVSRVLDELGKKSTRIKICKKFSTQLGLVVSQVGSWVPTHFDSSTTKTLLFPLYFDLNLSISLTLLRKMKIKWKR